MPAVSARRGRFASLLMAIAAATLVCLGLAGPAAAQTGHVRYAGAPRAVKSNYIVVFNDGAVPKGKLRAVTDALAAKHHATVQHRYGSALQGFSARMPEGEAERVAADPSVAYVEQDRTVNLAATELPTP